MKSLFLAVSLAILASCAPAFAGPILQDWCFVGTNTCTSSPTDTATFYLADANGVAKSDVKTVVGGASSSTN